MTAPREALSPRQVDYLLLAEAAGRTGYSARFAQPSLVALWKRGLVDHRHCRDHPGNRRWYATWAGREWVRSRPR